jgi:hypothetical protein
MTHKLEQQLPQDYNENCFSMQRYRLKDKANVFSRISDSHGGMKMAVTCMGNPDQTPVFFDILAKNVIVHSKRKNDICRTFGNEISRVTIMLSFGRRTISLPHPHT